SSSFPQGGGGAQRSGSDRDGAGADDDQVTCEGDLMRRPRMTIRGWMVVVAIAAFIALGLERTIALRRFQEQQVQLARLRAELAYKRALLQRYPVIEYPTAERWRAVNKASSQ